MVTCLSEKPLLTNGSYIFATLVAIAQQQMYIYTNAYTPGSNYAYYKSSAFVDTCFGRKTH
jgi:hypothetical protein